MKYRIKLFVGITMIMSICFTVGLVSLACNECQYMDHQLITLERTDVFIKGYATTWYVSKNHTLVHGAGTFAWANSVPDNNLGGQRSKTTIISGQGTVLGSHYESGNRAGCRCQNVW